MTDHLNIKPRKNATPRPAVKFYDVKSRIFSKSAKKDSADELPDDDEDDSWLDEPQELYDTAQELEAEKLSPINLASKYLATFLADTEDSSVTHMPLNVNKPQAASAIIRDDNDFSLMEF